ncbi:MAG: isocitrate lyase/PEP mutase family protein [Betaproteobacteria bacterium]|jgi:2-methylisocitrate lyase-like PEP mutase family enzyme
MSQGRALREALKRKPFLTSPGITTPLHAMIVEKAGFDFVYVGGYDVSLTLLGLPDVGFITETEMLNNARHIASSVKLPVIVDVDTGYGNALNVIRTVKDFEAAGVACIHIEDQVAPKRCGHVAGKMVIPLEEAAGKIRAATDARRDKDFMIMARTDAIAAAGGGLEEAIRRAKAYAKAGADMIWAEFPTAEPAQPQRFAQAVLSEYPTMPLYLNYSANLKWHESKVSFEDFAAMGYRIMHVSLTGLRSTMMGMWDYAVDLKARGAQAEIEFQQRLKSHPMGAFHEFAGFNEFKALEEKYLPAEQVKQKYEGGQGL